MDFKEFKFYIGEIVIFTQIIETDIKIIYTNVAPGNKQTTWDSIKKDSLGTIVKKLEELDSKRQLLTADDYYYLQMIAGIRNHWCHETSRNFLFAGSDFTTSAGYKTECLRLVDDHNKLAHIYKALEELRIKTVRDNK